MKKTMVIFCFVLLVQINHAQTPLNRSNIESAEKLFDLRFDNARRDSMLDGLQEQIGYFQKIHQIHLDNSVMPAILFNPIPVGMELPKGKAWCKIPPCKGLKKPMSEEELAYLSINQLAELLKSRQVSSLELTRMYLQRLKKYDPILHCVITLTEDKALQQARQVDIEIAAGRYKGLLHGIPFGVKDLLATKGYKTTWGSVAYKEQMIDQDATVVQKLDQAGAVLVAKLTMGELAWGDVWFGGKTRNPWNPQQGSSGSSAGSGSAVSAGLLPFAIGTETWGSIVSPATVNGVTGLRPTYGRVSRSGAMALSWSMDKIGVLCRNAEDAAIVLNAIYGPDGRDQTVYDVPFRFDGKTDLSGLRIGYLRQDFSRKYAFKKNDSLSLALLEKLGARLIPIELPAMSVQELAIILDCEAAASFDELTRTGRDSLLVRQIKNAWPNVLRKARFVPAVEYINANRLRTLLIQRMAELMKTVDLYVAPSDEGDNLLLTNLTGHPSVTIPNGFLADGSPSSISFIGQLFEEGRILLLAKVFQDAGDFHRKHPRL